MIGTAESRQLAFPLGPGVGVGAGVGTGVFVGRGVGVEIGVGRGVLSGFGSGVGDGVLAGRGVRVGTAFGLGFGLGVVARRVGGGAGTVRISSRALKKSSRFSASVNASAARGTPSKRLLRMNTVKKSSCRRRTDRNVAKRCYVKRKDVEPK